MSDTNITITQTAPTNVTVTAGVPGADGAISVDATNDGTPYARQDSGWVSIFDPLTIRQSVLDNPIVHLFKKNKLVETLAGTLTATRSGSASYVTRQGSVAYAPTDEMREEKQGWLMEISRTNDVLNSEVLVAGSFTTVTTNATAAPDGNTTADELIEDTSAGEHYAQDHTFTPTLSQDYVWSAFVKQGAGTDRLIMLRVASGNTASIIFDFSTGDFYSAGAGAAFVDANVEKLADGYYRISMIWNAVNATSTVCRVQMTDATGGISYTGNGTSSFYVWGRQSELGSYLTSYIATTGSPATRAADVITADAAMNNVAFVDNEFSIVTKFTPMGLDSSNQAIFDGAGVLKGFNDFQLLRVSTNNNIEFFRGSGAASVTVSPTAGTSYDLAVSVSDADLVTTYSDGVQTTSATKAPQNEGLNYLGTISFGSEYNGLARLSGHLSDFRLYDVELTANEIKLISGS